LHGNVFLVFAIDFEDSKLKVNDKFEPQPAGITRIILDVKELILRFPIEGTQALSAV
jgi:hypothetical protein